MTFSLYEASAPVFIASLTNMRAWLDKAAAEGDATALLGARLAEDMRPLPAQFQMASDSAKNCIARLAGIRAAVPTGTTLESLAVTLAPAPVAGAPAAGAAPVEGSVCPGPDPFQTQVVGLPEDPPVDHPDQLSLVDQRTLQDRLHGFGDDMDAFNLFQHFGRDRAHHPDFDMQIRHPTSS